MLLSGASLPFVNNRISPVSKYVTGRVGIGITTHNRNDLISRTLAELRRHTPQAFSIVVVDDASTVPVAEATFRFSENAGIAAAKNKCFELLDDCEHIFLFDDDTYPQCHNWWKPYVGSGEPHLLYMFEHFSSGRSPRDAALIYEDGRIRAWSHGRGCMLYFHHRCLDMVGGMNPIFGRWGYEHIELSSRIYNAGLTSFPFMDVADSARLFWSADEHEATASSVNSAERKRCLARNTSLWQSLRNGAQYVEYRQPPAPATDDVVIACYFVRRHDPQRGVKWRADYADLLPLIRSLKGRKLVLLHDCFDMDDTADVTHVRIAPREGPYWQRWISIYQWLIEHTEIRRVFCVDATDVEMLKDPFAEMHPFTLYVGSENTTMNTEWMLAKHPAEHLRQSYLRHAGHPLLNAGLLGGDRALVTHFIGHMLKLWGQNVAEVKMHGVASVGVTDMGLFNYVLMEYFRPLISFGTHVNTRFKAYEYNHHSWWKHK